MWGHIGTGIWYLDISAWGHIGTGTYRCEDSSVLGHICVGTAVLGHIGVETALLGHIGLGTAVLGHIVVGTQLCLDVETHWHAPVPHSPKTAALDKRAKTLDVFGSASPANLQ